MARSAFLVGHVLAEFAAAMLGVAVMTVAGLVVGWRIHTDVLARRSPASRCCVLFAFAMLWVGMLLGTVARSPDAVTGHRLHRHLPADLRGQRLRARPATLPGVLQHVRRVEPDQRARRRPCARCSATRRRSPADAAWPLQHPVASALLWCVALLAVAVPLAIAAYRRRTEG